MSIVLVLVTFVIFLIVRAIRKKRSGGLDLSYLCSLNEECCMATYNMMETYRNMVGDSTLWLDCFETDAVYTVMTNIGILTNEGTVMLPYSEIKEISAAKKTTSPVGNKLLWNEVVVTMKDGRQCPVKYQHLLKNCFSTLFANIVQKGYPVPEYQGTRE